MRLTKIVKQSMIKVGGLCFRKTKIIYFYFVKLLELESTILFSFAILKDFILNHNL